MIHNMLKGEISLSARGLHIWRHKPDAKLNQMPGETGRGREVSASGLHRDPERGREASPFLPKQLNLQIGCKLDLISSVRCFQR